MDAGADTHDDHPAMATLPSVATPTSSSPDVGRTAAGVIDNILGQ
ncbi:MAG TPA: hypothetical protein VFY38_15150 [Pseudonocardia sp.]|nr:hypothetical protein [Pseudonocardia sp.]